MKTRIKTCLCLCLALLLCLSACGKPAAPGEESGSSVSTQPVSSNANGIVLAEGIYITEVFSYTGAYVEDGQNEPCENICAVRLKNDSAEHYQYLEFEVETENGVYAFSASTLFSGARMTVLSKSKDPYTGAGVRSAKLVTLAPFAKTPTVHTDTLEITYTDGIINVKNLTDGLLMNVYVYFKEMDDFGYFGGITYRAGFGDILAGDIVQAGASNMHKDTSRVVFADYTE